MPKKLKNKNFLKATEKQIRKAVIDYLKIKGIFWWWNFNGIACYKGLSDLMVLRKGKLICLEIKSPTGKLSEHQEEFKRQVRRNDGIFWTIRSVDDVMKLFE